MATTKGHAREATAEAARASKSILAPTAPTAARLQSSIGNQAMLRQQALLTRTSLPGEEREAERVAEKVTNGPLASLSRIAEAVEREIGTPLGQVRFHADEAAAKRADLENALAFTVGHDVYFGRSHFDPGSRAGQRLIAHELAHVAQQQTSGPDRVQRLEAPKHEAAEMMALVRAGYSAEEASDVYFGNWMRDMNQLLVPTVLELTGNADFAVAFLAYAGAKKFGRQFALEDFGYYIPAEHIDSPAGLVMGLDVLPKLPPVSPGVLSPKPEPNPRGELDTKQEDVDPAAKVAGAGLFSVDQSGVIAFLRRTLTHIERRLQLAVREGRTAIGEMHLGAALHAAEDLFAHSNWIEIAVSKLLAEDPTLLPELKGKSRQVFNFARNVSLPSKSKRGASRPVLMTGSFTGLDTKMSVASELVNLLRAPYEPPASDEELRAQKQMTYVGLKAFNVRLSDPTQKAEFAALIEQNLSGEDPKASPPVLDPKAPASEPPHPWSRAVKHYRGVVAKGAALALVESNPAAAYRLYMGLPQVIPLPVHVALGTGMDMAIAPHKRRLAKGLEATALEGSVRDTSLLVNLERAERLSKDEFTEAELAEMKAIELGGDQLGRKESVAAQRSKIVAEQKIRLPHLQATPAYVLAGPSHSMIAKDHRNSPFFGLAFKVAALAVEMLGERVIDAWVEKHGPDASKPRTAASARGPSPSNTVKDEPGKTKEQLNEDFTKTQKEALAERRREKWAESKTYGEKVIEHGGDPDQDYDLAKKREKAAANVARTAAVLRAMAKSPGQAEAALKALSGGAGQLNATWAERVAMKLDSAAATVKAKGEMAAEAPDLETLAADLEADAKLIREARTGEAREAANLKLAADRDRAFVAMVARPDVASVTKTTILGALDQQTRETAVAYSTRQIEALAAAPAPVVEEMAMTDLTAEREKTPALARLLQTARDIFSHPYDGTWWRPAVRDYALKHRRILLASIEARNARHTVFPGEER